MLRILFLLALTTGAAFSKMAAVTGDFAVTVGGVTYNPASGRKSSPSNLKCNGKLQVRGVHVSYDIDCSTLGVYNYSLTGAEDDLRMVTTPTVVFASKVPTLSPAQLAGLSISSFDLQDDTFVVIFRLNGGKLKIQSKDGAQGGIFQMETEFLSDVEFVHTLGPSLFYFKNSVTGKINLSDGVAAVSKADSPTSYHKMLLGKDSPQVATKIYQDGSVTKWKVSPGGRLGGVLGEDSTELGAGASNCTSDCQAQNRIHGSIPPSQDPTDPAPL